jgi:hypothetical protein
MMIVVQTQYIKGTLWGKIEGTKFTVPGSLSAQRSMTFIARLGWLAPGSTLSPFPYSPLILGSAFFYGSTSKMARSWRTNRRHRASASQRARGFLC